jgi:two-component system sensor histidine kinase/response regulator
MTTVVKLQERIAELEEALRQSEKRYRAITETALAGIGITDPEENLTFVNSAFADMLGYAPGELVGMNLSLLTDPEEFDSYRERTREREGRGVRDHYATTLRRSDGSTVNVLVSASPLKAEDGSFHGTVGVVVDDTERKRAEEALASYARQQEALFQISAELARAIDEREVC